MAVIRCKIWVSSQGIKIAVLKKISFVKPVFGNSFRLAVLPMKTSFLVFLLLIVFIIELRAQPQPPIPTNNPTAYRIVAADADQNLWQSTSFITNKAGKVTPRIHKFYEVATGLNHWQNGEWVKSKEQIDPLPDGTAAATNGQHQAYFPGDLYEGTIRLFTPDEKLMESRPIALSYDDGTNFVIIAELTNTIGQLLGENQAIYTNAFLGISADVLFEYKREGFSQNIILHQQPPSPESFGLNPTTTKLQVLTEFFNAPEPLVNPTVVPLETGGTFPDHALDFGAMKMVPGRAFLTGANKETNSVLVGKQWVKIDGRTILAEEVLLDSLSDEISTLPQMAKAGARTNKLMASNKRSLPPQRLAQGAYKGRPMQLARLHKETTGLVLDYDTIIVNQTGYTFKGDTTYYIQGGFWLGQVIIEGGAVFKCSTTNDSWVNVMDALHCQTSPYRPAIFTTKDDDTVGEIIPGSTGNPTVVTNATDGLTISQNYYLFSYAGNISVHDIQVRYLRYGIGISTFGNPPSATNEVRDCQFYNVKRPIVANGNPVYPVQMRVRNALIEKADLAFNIVNEQIMSAENVTLHHVNYRKVGSSASSQIAFTNCLFVCVTNLSEWYDTSTNITCMNCATNSSDAGVFQTAGAGAYYLATNSPYHGVGTANIDSGLLARLRQKTTYPPVVYSNYTIATPTIFSPQVQVDTNNGPDLGFHYDPVDFAVSQCIVSNTILTVTNGAIIASYGQSGVQLVGGGQLVSIGTPLIPNLFVRGVSVQEQPYAGTNGILADASGTATALFRFTKFTCPAVSGYDLYHAGTSIFGNLDVQNCEFLGGANDLSGSTNVSKVTFKNNLFWRSSLNASNTSTQASLFLTNNTFWGTAVTLKQPSGGLWSAYNNNFDSSTVNGTLTNGYNAYLNTSGRLFPTNAPNIISATNLAYQSGSLGGFYLPLNSPLINAGNTNANLLGLYQYTVQTNQAKDANSMVDIGYHYVALNTNGYPLVSGGNGIPDYIGDPNGLSNWLSAPAIIVQPSNRTAMVADDVIFSVVTTGYPSPSYQWYFNGTPIGGGTNAALELDGVDSSNIGTYQVIVSNPLGSVTSQTASLTSLYAPYGYVIASGSLTNFNFQSDTTYYVNSTVQLYGTTTIEGGTVIKYGNHATSKLVLNGMLNCKTAPYRPALLTSKDDNSTGYPISQANGTPANNFNAIYLTDAGGQASTYHDLHIKYAGIGILGTNAVEVWDSQFSHGGAAVGTVATNGVVILNNVLIAQMTNCIMSAGWVVADFLTADQCASFGSASFGVADVANSILTSVGSLSGVNLASSVSLTNGAGTYQIAGGGSYYLATNTFQAQGTAIIDPMVQAHIAGKTTCPPLVYNNIPGFILSSNLNLFPQARRDENSLPDLGYHYDPLDYCFGAVQVTNATISVAAGTAIGIYGTNYSYGFGIAIGDNAKFICSGEADKPVHIVQYNTVQESIAQGWLQTQYACIGQFAGNHCLISCKFTDWSVMAQDSPHLNIQGFGTGVGPFNFQDCQFHGGIIYGGNPTLNFTNSLFERVYSDIEPGDENIPVFRNNTIFWGVFYYVPWNVDNAVVKDNLFDHPGIGTWFGSDGLSYDGGFNAYVTNCDTLMPISGNDSILNSSPAYQVGPLGNYYLPTNSPLINAGSTTAGQVGLYHFTTQTNQLKDGSSVVDIGYHYVALDTSTNLPDSNGNGIPDYVEDANGNGVGDSGETPWGIAIIAGPVDQIVVQSNSAEFSVLVSGMIPLTYQWFYNATNLIVGETNASMALVNVQATNAGLYSVVAANFTGSVTSSAASLIVLIPPSINAQPQSLTVFPGSNVTFQVTAAGTSPLAYQWYFNGLGITDATNATVTLTSVSTNAAGNYQVIVSNIAGSATSSVAALTVVMPPVIASQPTNQTTTMGNNVRLSVTAYGWPALAYQWRLEGTNFPGATNSFLKFINVKTNQSGNYSVVVSNYLGVITSSIATLTVQIPSTVYTTIYGSLTNFDFKSDSTYYVDSTVQLYGTTIIEGGAVIKYSNSPACQLVLHGAVNCLTATYRPALLTSADDNTVGATISGSTGTPVNYYNAAYLVDAGGQTNAYHNLRIKYAGTGISGPNPVNVFDTQFIVCSTAVSNSAASTIGLHNVLISHVTNVVDTAGGVTAEFLTVDQCQRFLRSTNGGANLTNCILTAVGNTNGLNLVASVSLSSGVGIYRVVNGGSYYLATNTFQTQGITNIDPALLIDIAAKTTWPPIVWDIPGGCITNDLNLYQQAQRDTNSSPDLGYHYDPLDFGFGGMFVSNATITVNAGVAVAVGSTNLSFGLAIADNANFLCLGLPDRLVHVVQYNTVQESVGLNCLLTSAGGIAHFNGTNCGITCRFTDWSVMAQDVPHFKTQGQGALVGPFNFQHCEFHGGQLISLFPAVNFTNCLFERVRCDVEPGDYRVPVFRNNTVYGGFFGYGPATATNAVVCDNLFDQANIPDWIGSYGRAYAGGGNAFITNCDRLFPQFANDIILAGSPAYQTGRLGNYYLPSDSPLIDAGSTTADKIGLYQFTTQTNQAREAFTYVDIGYHRVAIDLATGQPYSSYTNAVPDYVSDSDGNGLPDFWEITNFGQIGADAHADSDGDGWTNFQEYRNGTNPNTLDEPLNVIVTMPGAGTIVP